MRRSVAGARRWYEVVSRTYIYIIDLNTLYCAPWDWDKV
jgi:hypothetical protein